MQVPAEQPAATTFAQGDAPAICANVEGSYAWDVLHRRHPVLINHLAELHPYPAAIRQRLAALSRELADGPIGQLPEDAHDRTAWDAWGEALFGRPWPDVPALWAESYFHRRLLDAVAFFEPGIWFRIDPFTPMKEADLRRAALGEDLRALTAPTHLPASDTTLALLLTALWGNKWDLGFRLGMASVPGRSTLVDHLVVDDTPAIRDLLHTTAPGRICLVADNAGPELISDLLLTDHLLHHSLASRVTLQVKPYPHFVSDAVPADVMSCLRTLAQSAEPVSEVGRRLGAALRDGRLEVTDHWFFCSPQPFHHLPDELRAVYAEVDLTIMKGDLNYRRLVGDFHWPPKTDFAHATAYFPGPVAALRVHKSEVVVGVEATRLRSLAANDTAWRTDGRYGTAQLRT
ncbi:damage-control phosphatase ARMT1 family protein [Streptomyces europaeiscabiei]|uniref:damage-control phosphatase ARMT1 family protein n=1 Tax=Streptomyces europaeiscabiei TaxID=146819 RepID=UPI0029A9D453|nr:damage-control phosphatase ARMT1 family protein [Streptomyces europaeiscabiei]MDX3611301.1 damage-control phosphatase ARMT1 family protein [Streptomyces europaeiscabiei]